jgi:hypothetical protein
MAKAHIEYAVAPEDAYIDCKPSTPPTELYQFAVCQHCDKVYIAENSAADFKLKWFRVQRFSQASRMYKRALKAANAR